MLDDKATEKLEEDFFECCLNAAESLYRDINELLRDLHEARGASFISLLRDIASHGEFKLLKGEDGIYITGGKSSEDYNHLLNAARKAVEFGYRVYILPNPKGIRTADFIFERKGVFRMYDLKTIQGKASAGTRLKESIGQTNRVLLNIGTEYNARLLASDIKTYFETNIEAVEVLIFKGRKMISVSREHTQSAMFNRIFRRKYEK